MDDGFSGEFADLIDVYVQLLMIDDYSMPTGIDITRERLRTVCLAVVCYLKRSSLERVGFGDEERMPAVPRSEIAAFLRENSNSLGICRKDVGRLADFVIDVALNPPRRRLYFPFDAQEGRVTEHPKPVRVAEVRRDGVALTTSYVMSYARLVDILKLTGAGELVDFRVYRVRMAIEGGDLKRALGEMDALIDAIISEEIGVRDLIRTIRHSFDELDAREVSDRVKATREAYSRDREIIGSYRDIKTQASLSEEERDEVSSVRRKIRQCYSRLSGLLDLTARIFSSIDEALRSRASMFDSSVIDFEARVFRALPALRTSDFEGVLRELLLPSMMAAPSQPNASESFAPSLAPGSMSVTMRRRRNAGGALMIGGMSEAAEVELYEADLSAYREIAESLVTWLAERPGRTGSVCAFMGQLDPSTRDEWSRVEDFALVYLADPGKGGCHEDVWGDLPRVEVVSRSEASTLLCRSDGSELFYTNHVLRMVGQDERQ